MGTLTIPPYRAALLTGADGTPMVRANGPDSEQIQTERQWYMFWQNVASQINAGSKAIDSLEGLVTFGNHADRPDGRFQHDGALYIEQDRGSVLYQNQGGIWVYIAGIMYGTLVPDQRPADLGPAADAGFQFRTTTDPARAFTWNGGQWVETTPIRYGTHAERLAETIANLVSGMLWMETDRGSVIYQNQGGTWLFLSGTMWDTMSPDHRPTDLGVHDAGFDYRTTDPPAREFIWNQTAWVEITQSQPGDVQQSGSSASLTLTTTPTVIPGATLTLNRAGRYLITGNFVFLVVNDPSQGLRGNLLAGGVQLGGGTLVAQTNNNTFAAVSQQWVYAAAGAGVVVSLLANKDGGTGTSTAFAPATSITALWVST